VSSKSKDHKSKENQTVIVDLNEEKELYTWESSERPFKKRNAEFWSTSIIILALVSIIFIFIKEYMLVVALFSALFLYYVMSSIQPRIIINKITNRGVYYGDVKYEWALLRRFWFTKSLDSQLVCFETNLRFPRQISFVIQEQDKDKIKEITLRRIPLVEESPQFVEKVNKWFVAKFPIERKK
jgi:hypothetical protein